MLPVPSFKKGEYDMSQFNEKALLKTKKKNIQTMAKRIKRKILASELNNKTMDELQAIQDSLIPCHNSRVRMKR